PSSLPPSRWRSLARMLSRPNRRATPAPVSAQLLPPRHEWFPADSSPVRPYPQDRKLREGFAAPVSSRKRLTVIAWQPARQLAKPSQRRSSASAMDSSWSSSFAWPAFRRGERSFHTTGLLGHQVPK